MNGLWRSFWRCVAMYLRKSPDVLVSDTRLIYLYAIVQYLSEYYEDSCKYPDIRIWANR